MNPKISIFATAHRPQNWMNLYKSIGDNQVDFELVFVGPNPPDYQLPKNFRFIRSLVKPAQCAEIAFRNTAADLVMNMADDCVFKTSRPLDRLYQIYKSYNNDKIIFSCRYMINGQEQPFAQHYYFPGDFSPIIPLSGLMSRNLFSSIGGIDRNFIGTLWDLDIVMRIYALGGDVVFSDVFVDEDKGKSGTLYKELGRHDGDLLNSLWIKDGKVNFSRAKPVEPFDDLNILVASQGPRGRWRGNHPILLEKIEDRIRRYGLFLKRVLVRVGRGIRKPHMYSSYAKRIVLYIKRGVLGLKR